MAHQTTDSELNRLLEHIVEAVRDLGWHNVVLVLHDELTQTTCPAAAATTDPNLKANLLANTSAPLDPRMWRRDSFRVSRSYFVDHRLHQDLPTLAGEPEHADYSTDLTRRSDDEWHNDDFLIIPLVIDDEEVGWLAVNDPMDHRRPTTATVRMLEIFADQAALTIQQARLYRHVRDQVARQNVLYEIAQLSRSINSTLELDEVLELALEQLARVINYDTASILLVEGDNLRITACKGFQNPQSLIGALFRVEEDNISHRVMRSRQVRVVPDVQELPEWGHHRDDVEGFEKIRGWIGAPLLVREESIGLLVIDKLEPDFYTEEDGETVAGFATQIAIALQNARLYQATQQQRDKLAAILTDITDAVIVLDESLHLWLLNPAAQRTFKLPREKQLIGQPIHALDLPELSAVLERAQLAQQSITQEITGPDDTSLNLSLAPVRDVGWIIVIQDITPFKELDRLRTEWVAAISHDLKNPIQMIQLGAALLEIDGPLNETQLERINIIQRGAEQLSKLVTNVLDLARLEAGPTLRLMSTEPYEFLTASLAEVEHLAAKKQQRIATKIAPNLPVISSDAKLLQRALVNLLSNAIKYTPVGGTITLHVALDDRNLMIEIIDNGPGIPTEALPRLFERFYRVPGTAIEGTGLGLSIVKSIVEKHNGSVQVRSAEGIGSTFLIILPCE